VLYTEQEIGRFKVEAALSALKARNSEIELSAIAKPMTTRLAEELVPHHDVVLDAGDSLALSYALSDVCLAHNKPLISASVVEMAGYVGQFCAMVDGTPLPSYRALFPSVPATIGSCDTLGVMGSAVGVMASLQAHMALSCLLGNGQALAAKLFTFDFHSLNLRKIDFASAQEPDAPSLPLLGVEDFEALDVVVELRGQNEVATLPTPNALRLLPEAAIAADLPKDQRLVLCCATGLRSSRVADALHRRGYTKLAIAALG
jgi:rhodanese-related sulfurtransferase